VVCVAPRYTSAVASFSRFLGQIASVVAPYMIGSIVTKGTREEWQIAFYIMAFVLISTGIFFQFGGSGNLFVDLEEKWLSEWKYAICKNCFLFLNLRN
jgi:hypothetical protein